MKNVWSQKRIPTLLGLGVLVAGLVAGVFALGQGFGAFSPRATAETTPKNLEVTNVTDTGFTVSFFTDGETTSFIKYGTEADKLNKQVSDDRDQIAGTVSPYTTHYLSIRELQPNTPYYFVIGTTAREKFDDNGTPFVTKTAARGGSPGPALTIYGNVTLSGGAPAAGAVVYAEISGVGKVSSLVKESGSWSIPLSSARLEDGTAFAKIEPTSSVILSAHGRSAGLTATSTTTVGEAQPAPALTLGESITGDSQSLGGSPLTSGDPVISGSEEDRSLQPDPVFPGGSLSQELASTDSAAIQNPDLSLPVKDGIDGTMATQSSEINPGPSLPPITTPAVAIVDVQSAAKPVLTTTQPVIVGQAPANVLISIEVHSNEAITSQVQADAAGAYSLNIAELSKTLEPGEHTVTISYTDPQTGELVTQTKTFTVSAKATAAPVTPAVTGGNTSSGGQLLALNTTTTTPFSSSNPYATSSATPTTATSSTKATSSAVPRTSLPASGSGIPASGTTSTTLAVLGAGLFLILTGLWSYFASRESDAEESANV